jgi:catechol 2,3-dioxygenase-like lactoylglutathione lyase family enzyme
MDDREFLVAFEATAIPRERWTHRDHVRMAFLYLRDHPFDDALSRMRSGIQALNRANQVPETETSGYHETVTVAWARLVESTIGAHGPTSSFEDFGAANPHLLQKTLLRLYYTRARILSEDARSRFVEPDLAPLPGAAPALVVQSEPGTVRSIDRMEYKSCFPVVVTPRLAEARDFYTKNLGFHVVFEADWYVQLHAPREGGGKPIELAFMKPGQQSQPPSLRHAFDGRGIILTLEVEDVDSIYAAVRSIGCETVVDLRDEPWGQRHFLIRDPAGNLLDVVKQIPPSSEYEASYT